MHVCCNKKFKKKKKQVLKQEKQGDNNVFKIIKQLPKTSIRREISKMVAFPYQLQTATALLIGWLNEAGLEGRIHIRECQTTLN